MRPVLSALLRFCSASRWALSGQCLLQRAFAGDKAGFARVTPRSWSSRVNITADFITAALHTDSSYSGLGGSPVSCLRGFFPFSSSFLEKKDLLRLIDLCLKKAGIICRLLTEQSCSSSWWRGILFKFGLVHRVANSHCLSHMNHWINMSWRLRVSLEL